MRCTFLMAASPHEAHSASSVHTFVGAPVYLPAALACRGAEELRDAIENGILLADGRRARLPPVVGRFIARIAYQL